MKDPAIVTALISGLCVAIPTIISVIVTSNTRDILNEERIKNLSKQINELSERVQIHNSFAERIALIERDIKTIYKRIDELKEAKHG